jgi:hypothetical protein
MDEITKDPQAAPLNLEIEVLEERIAPSSFPPGQFPSGNPAQAPGNSGGSNGQG